MFKVSVKMYRIITTKSFFLYYYCYKLLIFLRFIIILTNYLIQEYYVVLEKPNLHQCMFLFPIIKGLN